MPTHIFERSVTERITIAQAAARLKVTKTVPVGNQSRTVRSPFPSPEDWRDKWIYFLMIDRFNRPAAAPRGAWNRRFDFRQGGTFKGVQSQLEYLERLGVKAIWLSPVLKNARPDQRFNYHGYGQQDFLNVDERFASDGTRATAERELTKLIDESHARDIYGGRIRRHHARTGSTARTLRHYARARHPDPRAPVPHSALRLLWGKPAAFDTNAPAFTQIQKLTRLRDDEPAVRYGRFYFREVSGNALDFGHSFGAGGVVAFSRILVDREVLVVANTGSQPFSGAVILDRDIHATPGQMSVAYSNRGGSGTGQVRVIRNARFFNDGRTTTGTAAAIDVIVKAGEVQALTPV